MNKKIEGNSQRRARALGSGPVVLALSGLAMLLGAAMPAFAEPAQVPLTNRTALPPKPNVMVTIDDSGSMLFDFMPEQVFKVNGYSVQIAESIAAQNWPAGFPSDPVRKVTITSGRNTTTYSYQTGTVPASRTYEALFQKQFRSPDVNALFYNPDLRYRPWVDVTNLPNDMAQASFSAARWEPRLTSTFDLSTTKQYAGRTVAWCKNSYNDCPAYTDQYDFYPGLVYRLKAGADPNASASYVRYDVNGNGDAYAPDQKHANRVDCVSATKCTQAEEKQNFANWFTYYRFRESMFKAALGRSLVDYQDKIRVGWSRFHPDNPGALPVNQTVQQDVRLMDHDHLVSVLTNIYNVSSFGGTPTRLVLDDVGVYFKKTGTVSPWYDTVTGKTLECRRSVNLLMTDGYYNDSNDDVANDDVDGTSGTDYKDNNPNGYSPTQYVPTRPFTDPTPRSKTLADVAMKYFKYDLRTDVVNKVAPIDGDIAYWQHLTQFMVGLGVTGTLDSSTPTKKLETLKKIKAGTLSWPDPTAGSPEKIDDMWHAAVNTGGDFYSVRDVSELSDAMGDAIGRAAGGEAKEAGIAVASNTLVTGNLKLVPKYQSASWNGDLEAYEIDAAGLVSDKPTWVASDLTKLPAAKDRNLYTWDGSTAVKFVHGTGADTMGQANSTTVGSASLTNYIRGDATDEGVGNLYRSRGKKYLGDFVNSPPVYVKGLVDLNYDSIGTGYRDYVALKKARSNAVVFLGGNAGVLHAFHGGTGAELFGYLPRAGLGNLHTIAEKDYGTPSNYHRYFVDGPVTETDAFIKTRRNTTAAAWSNLLVGSMGAGGTGFFALHVDTSNPTTLDANTLLWERSAADDDNIGYIISEIAVGKLKGGGWKAFVGNGVDSKSGAAALLVVDLATGTIDKTLAVDSSGNGLMGVSLLKDKSTQEVVGAYAGDLKGNLWRFDFGSTGLPANWAVGFKGKPLFTAQMGTAQQAITIAPTYLSHSEGPGRVVLFGTGKLLSTDDAKSTTTQSFYGVLDPTADGASAEKDKSPFDAVDDDRQLLQPRTIVTTPVATKDGKSYYAVTGSPVQWGSQYGWMMDLPFSGQRDIYPPVIVAGTYVLVQTMLPAGDAADCEVSSGTGYNYFLTARDGSPLTSPIFDTTGDGIIDEKDTIAAGYSTSADGSDRVLDSDDSGGSGGGGGGGGGGLKCRVGYHAALIEPTNPKGEWACYPNASKTIVDRIWRQIMNPPKAP